MTEDTPTPEGVRRFFDDLFRRYPPPPIWRGRCPACVGSGRLTDVDEEGATRRTLNRSCPWCYGDGQVTYQPERAA